MPEEIEGVAAVIGTGRSDYPNQINNVLAFPGVFRGALDVRATAITEEMKLAAARGDRSHREARRARGGLRDPERLQSRTSPRRSRRRSRGLPRRRGLRGVIGQSHSRRRRLDERVRALDAWQSVYELWALRAEALVGQPREMRRWPLALLLRVE